MYSNPQLGGSPKAQLLKKMQAFSGAGREGSDAQDCASLWQERSFLRGEETVRGGRSGVLRGERNVFKGGPSGSIQFVDQLCPRSDRSWTRQRITGGKRVPKSHTHLLKISGSCNKKRPLSIKKIFSDIQKLGIPIAVQ